MSNELSLSQLNEVSAAQENEPSLSWSSSYTSPFTESQHQSAPDPIKSGIFERSLSVLSIGPSTTESPKTAACNSISNSRKTRLGSIASTTSLKRVALHHSVEDFIPPVLDHTTEILTDPLINLNDVKVVCGECECESGTNGSKELISAKRQRTKASNLSSKFCVRSRSRSHICNSLMAALASNEEDEETDDKDNDQDESMGDQTFDSNTINFYSYNDILHREMDLEKFSTFRMSKLLLHDDFSAKTPQHSK